jgi:outer membrane murein-binding lipoprotein Lpp
LDTCSEAEAPCPHSIHGCGWVGSRASTPTHLETCAYEGIRSFIELSTWRYDQLSHENAQLRSELAQLRDTLNAVRGDLVRDIAAIAPPIDLLPHIDRLTADNERVSSDVQSITADMASMDLRHNMAVMNESFRMREEMQALRQMCQVMQSQIMYLSDRLKDSGRGVGAGMPSMPPMPAPKSDLDGQFAGAADRFNAAVGQLSEPSGRGMGRRPSSARSNSADGSGSEGGVGRSMKL